MAKEWFFNYKVTTFKGRVIERSGKVSDPAKHFAEYLRRFHPTAKTIEWVPTKPDNKTELGPKRSVEFDEEGRVVSRTPDIDAAHVGGGDWKPDEKNPEQMKPGDSRKGVVVAEQKDVGRSPHVTEVDEEEEEFAEAGKPQQQGEQQEQPEDKQFSEANKPQQQ